MHMAHTSVAMYMVCSFVSAPMQWVAPQQPNIRPMHVVIAPNAKMYALALGNNMLMCEMLVNPILLHVTLFDNIHLSYFLNTFCIIFIKKIPYRDQLCCSNDAAGGAPDYASSSSSSINGSARGRRSSYGQQYWRAVATASPKNATPTMIEITMITTHWSSASGTMQSTM